MLPTPTPTTQNPHRLSLSFSSATGPTPHISFHPKFSNQNSRLPPPPSPMTPPPPPPPPPPSMLLPTSSSASLRHCLPRPRRPHPTTLLLIFLSLLLSSAAWLSLVFSSSSPLLLHPLPSTSPLLPSTPLPSPSSPLSLPHIIFGIAGSSRLWPRRRHFLRLWWRPSSMRGHVWLDQQPLPPTNSTSLPPLRVSEDIARFRYTNPTGHPSGLRIARILAETFHLRPRDARWFLLCDDDTLLSPDNLVAVLAKYDWREMVYVGAPSESHSANTYFSHTMAFGGGGVAISYPLAEALTVMQDECLERYPKLYGSDDRLHACITELGVPLTRERGFHQWDIRGNAHGLLAAHPIAPFVSIHHVEEVDPLYPGLSSLESLKLFTKAMNIDPRSFLQRAVYYDRAQKLTFSVSLGYVVQVFPIIVLPRDLERSERTYAAWNWLSSRDEFDFDTKDAYKSVCKKPILFFLKDVRKDGNATVGSYVRTRGRDDLKRKVFCFPRSPPLADVSEIQVSGNPLSDNWHLYDYTNRRHGDCAAENIRQILGH